MLQVLIIHTDSSLSESITALIEYFTQSKCEITLIPNSSGVELLDPLKYKPDCIFLGGWFGYNFEGIEVNGKEVFDKLTNLYKDINLKEITFGLEGPFDQRYLRYCLRDNDLAGEIHDFLEDHIIPLVQEYEPIQEILSDDNWLENPPQEIFNS